MFVFYDFGELTEFVAEDVPSEEYDLFDKSLLGTFAGRVLSVDYRELAKNIATLLQDNLSTGCCFPKNKILDVFKNAFGNLRFSEGELLLTCLENYYNSIQTNRDDINKTIYRLYFTNEHFFSCEIFRCFVRIAVMQAYLDKSDENPNMLSCEEFERFIDVIYEGKIKINKQEDFYSTSDYSLDDMRLFPDDDLGEMVQDIFNKMEPFYTKCISMNFKYLADFVTSTIYYVFLHGYKFNRCKNCGRFFIPHNRNDELYCSQLSPQDNTRTCKQYAKDRLWYDKLKQDEVAKLARNVYSSKQMLVRRNPDISAYKDMFEHFKLEKKKWETDVKEGRKTREQYYSWLQQMKSKKAL